MDRLFKADRRTRLRPLLYFLLGIDFAFIALSLLRFRLPFSGDLQLLSVAEDGSYAEHFQYLKFGLVIVLLSLLAKSKKSLVIGSWAFVFLLLLIDDSARLHEQIGTQLAVWFALPSWFNLRPKDFGELAVYGLMGAIVLLVLAIAARCDRTALAQLATRQLLVPLAGLACFGGAADMLNVAAKRTFTLPQRALSLLDALEDGGEMLALTAALWLTCCLCAVAARSPQITATANAALPMTPGPAQLQNVPANRPRDR